MQLVGCILVRFNDERLTDLIGDQIHECAGWMAAILLGEYPDYCFLVMRLRLHEMTYAVSALTRRS